MKENGWNDIERITLCNDTVAALLAGATVMPVNEVSSYIGMILGTGLNAAYIQEKNDEYKIERQIVVCESGKFLSINKSDFDVEVDRHSVKPGEFLLEKSCSGAYLGPITYYALKMASEDEIFSCKMNEALSKLEGMTLIEMDGFLHAPYNTEHVLGKICAENATEEDYNKLFQLLDAIVERSARHVAAILCACAKQTGMGTNATKPICILCNGTTFLKTHKIRSRVFGYLDEILTIQNGIYWKVVSCDNDITLGTAISGLI